MSEEWLQWAPREKLAKCYHVSSVMENDEGLTILLAEDKHEERGLKVSFGYTADAFF